MLTPEQAREALEQAAVRDDRALHAAASALADAERPIAWTLLDREFDGKVLSYDDWGHVWKVRQESADRLDALGPAGRRALWAAFFPRLDVALLEGTWRLLASAPYRTGSARRPFRAPGEPARTRESRHTWLRGLVQWFAKYDPDLDWLAAWSGHLGHWGSFGGPVLAAAIDLGGPRAAAVLDTLRDSAGGTHPIGTMGPHLIPALLAAGDPDGWEFVEKLLLAAQREEGLRQAILEAVDFAHPAAFRRMLRLIVEHDLARFSATVRAVDVWLGFAWDSASVKVVNATLERLIRYLDDPDARARAIAAGQAEDAYLALWAIAFDDAPAAIAPAAALLDDPDVERRFAGVHLLAELALRDATLPALLRAYEDVDLRVAVRADLAFDESGESSAAAESDLFERAERLLERVPAKPKVLAPIVWPWQALAADRRVVTDTLSGCLGSRPIARLAKHLALMDPTRRERVARLAIDRAADARETRDLLLELTADPGAGVRGVALEGLKASAIGPEEARRLEPLLARKADDLRRGVLALLIGQADPEALAGADRLLAASKLESRLAGLELLRQLAEAGRSAAGCQARAARFQDGRTKLNPEEAKQVEAILDTGRKVATLADCLGLIDPADRTEPVPPVARDRPWITPAALACLRSLSKLVHKHRDERVEIRYGRPDEEVFREDLLGNLRWGVVGTKPPTPIADDLARLPLHAVWESWWQDRPPALRDADGLELLRASVLAVLMAEQDDDDDEDDEPRDTDPGIWCIPAGLADEIRKKFGARGLEALPYGRLVQSLLPWLIRMHPPEGAADFLLDAFETALHQVPARLMKYAPETDTWAAGSDWRGASESQYTAWLDAARAHRVGCREDWTAAHHVRLFRQLRWMDEPGAVVPRHRATLNEVLAALAAGGATEADLIDQLLGPRGGDGENHHELRHLTGRTPPEEFVAHPALREVVDRCRRRVVEVELERGEAPTAASAPALALSAIEGSATLTRLLEALGDRSFHRAHNWRGDRGKAVVLTHLVRVAFPAPSDTPESFAAEVRRPAISADRLVELAVFAPQWARLVEHALAWPQLEEAVWWLHAHTKGGDWSVALEVRELWAAEVAARTALAASDLVDGAVDVAWFQRVYPALGPKRWPVLDEAARFASDGSGHARARLFASAMLGKLKKAELVGRIDEKRNADALRALGLLPLARGAARPRDLLDRYRRIQEFLRTSKQFGAQRQASEKRAGAIALDNLARTAGYADPIRLEWAMEARAVADLADGPVTVEVDGVTVALALDEFGQAELTAERAGKPLKAIPPALKKHKQVAELAGRKVELKRQATRVRQSLEAAMCRGDALDADELKQLAGHAVLWPLLSRLVLLGEGIAGYPAEAGRALRGHDGRLEPIKPAETLRIAHPHDLLGLGDWQHWQHDCFRSERVQPFKQVFRELYVLTDAEKAEAVRSLRYAGHQVNPSQALALLGSRGWVNHPDEGVRKTFHEAGLTASLDVLGLTFSAADVEGITLESVRFARRGAWKPTPLDQVPPRLFSEVMRDLDLVVSVAHRGGVDPEASASTVAMRGSLLRETCALLGLKNVRVKGSHSLIDGQLGNYSLHLGSGVVHRQPGGALCIVPVHAQHRGRLFLPFADDDPKTAEVMSKALLLARDSEIKDPTILAQIRAAT